MIEIFGYILFFLGIVFLLLSSLGIVRMPDTLTRMQVATKAATLGLILVCLGAICFEPTIWFKLLLLILFVLLTNPLSSSILAKSSYLKGESKQC